MPLLHLLGGSIGVGQRRGGLAVGPELFEGLRGRDGRRAAAAAPNAPTAATPAVVHPAAARAVRRLLEVLISLCRPEPNTPGGDSP